MHAQPSSGARYLIIGQNLRLLPYFMCANSEGSGETARMHRLAWAFAGRLSDKYHNLVSWLKLKKLFSHFFRSFLFERIFHLHMADNCNSGIIFFINELAHDKTNKMICPVWSVFAVCMKKLWVLSYPFSAKPKVIRLGGCASWSESLLDAQVILLVLSCSSSFLWLVERSKFYYHKNKPKR